VGQRNFSWIALVLPYLEGQAQQSQIDFKRPLWGQLDANGNEIASQSLESLKCPSDPGFQQEEGNGLYYADGKSIGWTNYAGAEGYDWWYRGAHEISGVFNLNASVRIRDIKDGTSNTIAVGECSTKAFEPRPNVAGHLKNGGGKPRGGAEENSVYRCAFLACNTNDDVHQNWQLPRPDGTVQGFWWRQVPYAMQPTYLHCFGMNNNWPGASSFHPGGAQFLMADASARFLSETLDYPGENITGWAAGSGVWGALNTYAGKEAVSAP
jgi:hypothetical protein